MNRADEIRALIAASVYEPLSAEEEARLERALAENPALAAEAEALRGTVARIPCPDVEFTGDLLPVLRERIREEAGRPAWLRWGWLAPVAACVLVALVLAPGWMAEAPEAPVAVLQETPASPLEATLAEAEALLAKREVGEALRLLEHDLALHPDAVGAGQVQLALADIEYGHLQRYERAHDAYKKLRSEYSETFTASPLSITRFDLLDECRAKGFDALYAFDAARNNPESEAFARLEQLVVRYPGSLLAGMVVDEMRQLVSGDEADSGPLKAAALETVRARCADPLAVAQINVALGDTYWRELKDGKKARDCYTPVAESPHLALAQLAQDALTAIDAAGN